jgi:hypothetical protein
MRFNNDDRSPLIPYIFGGSTNSNNNTSNDNNKHDTNTTPTMTSTTIKPSVVPQFYEAISYLTMLLKCRLPAVETDSACAEVPASPTDMPRFLSMLETLQLALNIAIFRGHRTHPPSRIGLRNRMSRKISDIYKSQQTPRC